MAVLKDFKTPHGIDAHYHRIHRVEFQVTEQVVLVTVAVFVSPEHRAAGVTPLWHEYVSIPFASLSEDPRAAIYNLITNFDGSYLHGATSDEVEPS